LETSNRLAIQPLHPGVGTNIFTRKHTSISVDLPVTNAQFLRILASAFENYPFQGTTIVCANRSGAFLYS